MYKISLNWKKNFFELKAYFHLNKVIQIVMRNALITIILMKLVIIFALKIVQASLIN